MWVARVELDCAWQYVGVASSVQSVVFNYSVQTCLTLLDTCHVTGVAHNSPKKPA